MPAQELLTKAHVHEEEFPLEFGSSLERVRIAYETWGTLSPGRDNAVCILHALSGSSHVFSSVENPEPGWWERFLDENSTIHPERHFIICANILGGCYGTTGPSSVEPSTGKKYALRFPQITIGDMVEAQRLLVRALGIDRPLILIGPSMGGMLVLEWAVKHPEDVSHAIIIGSNVRSYAQTIALRSVQREAILSDPAFNGGDYDEERFPRRGLALARKIGFITYRSDLEFNARFGRRQRDARPHFLEGRFEVQSYLDHHGRKFVERFDANTYLYYSRAMDLYDAAKGYASLDAALSRVEAKSLLVGIDSDFLCPMAQVREVYEGLRSAGREAVFETIHSIHGHDSFLVELEQIHSILRRFLEPGR
jgi:homoserine O-acetyltransferase